MNPDMGWSVKFDKDSVVALHWEFGIQYSLSRSLVPRENSCGVQQYVQLVRFLKQQGSEENEQVPTAQSVLDHASLHP